MSHNPLSNASFLSFLEAADRELAESTRARLGGRCPEPGCQGRLHWANYPRKPRGWGAWPDLDPTGRVARFSLCCSQDGCRRRVTPISVRFLGRKVYFGAIVVLASAIMDGLSDRHLRWLRRLIQIDRRTLLRWRRWWQEEFAESPFWRAERARFPDPPKTEGEADCLAHRLLGRFPGPLLDRLLRSLRFLAPITSGSAPESRALRGA